MEPEYIVRRLTLPRSVRGCRASRTGGAAALGRKNPTEDDLAFWREVFETHRKIAGTSTKPKTDRQIIKWLKDPIRIPLNIRCGETAWRCRMSISCFRALCITHSSRTFIVTFFSHTACLFLPFRVINVVPKTKEVQKMRFEFNRTGAERKALVQAMGRF